MLLNRRIFNNQKSKEKYRGQNDQA